MKLNILKQIFNLHLKHLFISVFVLISIFGSVCMTNEVDAHVGDAHAHADQCCEYNMGHMDFAQIKKHISQHDNSIGLVSNGTGKIALAPQANIFEFRLTQLNKESQYSYYKYDTRRQLRATVMLL